MEGEGSLRAAFWVCVTCDLCWPPQRRWRCTTLGSATSWTASWVCTASSSPACSSRRRSASRAQTFTRNKSESGLTHNFCFCFECFQFFRSKSRAAGNDIYSVSHRTQETHLNSVQSGTSVLLHVLQLLPVRFVFKSSQLLIEKIQDSRTLIRHRKFLNLETWKGPIRSDVTD